MPHLSVHELYAAIYILTIFVVAVGLWLGFGAWRRKFIRSIEQSTSHLQRRLKESEERAGILNAFAMDIVHSVDTTGHIISANSYTLSLLGYEHQELLDRPMQELYGRATWRALTANFKKLKLEGVLVLPNTHMVKKDGTVLDVDIHALSIYDEHGNFVKVRCIIRDVTDRRRSENILRLLEDKYRTLVETVPGIICRITREGTILFTNNFSTDTLGYKPSELEGQNWWKTFFPDTLNDQVESFLSSLGEQDELKDYRMTLVNKHGALRTFSWNARTMRNRASYELDEILLVGTDVAERKRMEDSLFAQQGAR
jgi:PAS domain S-box-containing protein